MNLKFDQNNFIWAYFSVSFLSDCFLLAKTGDTIIINQILFKQRQSNASAALWSWQKNRFESDNIDERHFCEPPEPTLLMLSGFVQLEIILNKKLGL